VEGTALSETPAEIVAAIGERLNRPPTYEQLRKIALEEGVGKVEEILSRADLPTLNRVIDDADPDKRLKNEPRGR